jgi:hypothetical protein
MLQLVLLCFHLSLYSLCSDCRLLTYGCIICVSLALFKDWAGMQNGGPSVALVTGIVFKFRPSIKLLVPRGMNQSVHLGFSRHGAC